LQKLFDKNAVVAKKTCYMEQLIYYEHFRKLLGKPGDVFNDKSKGKQCPYCQSYVKTKIAFCKVCGAYPI
jgi:hypothetical protein